MKTATAFNIIQTCEDIKKYRRMIYSPTVVEAFDIVFAVGQKFFAEAE